MAPATTENPQTRATRSPEASQRSGAHLVPLNLIARELCNLAKMFTPLAAGAILVALLILPPSLVFPGAVVALLIMTFVGMPMWLAALGSDLEERTHAR
jgi:hypothetical protein